MKQNIFGILIIAIGIILLAIITGKFWLTVSAFTASLFITFGIMVLLFPGSKV